MTDAAATTPTGPTSAQLVDAIPGLTYRRLDYWVRLGYLGEVDVDDLDLQPGHGYQRHYSAEQVLMVRHLAHLTWSAHIELERASRMAREAKRIWSGEWQWLTDGRDITVLWRLPASLTADLADVLEVQLP